MIPVITTFSCCGVQAYKVVLVEVCRERHREFGGESPAQRKHEMIILKEGTGPAGVDFPAHTHTDVRLFKAFFCDAI